MSTATPPASVRRRQRTAASGVFSEAASGDFRMSASMHHHGHHRAHRRNPRRMWRLLRHCLVAHARLLRYVVRLTSAEEATLRRVYTKHEAAKGTGNARLALAKLGLLPTDADLARLSQHGTVVSFEDFAAVVVDKKRQFARQRRQNERCNAVTGSLAEFFDVDDEGRQRLDRDHLTSVLGQFGVQAEGALPADADLTAPNVAAALGLQHGDSPDGRSPTDDFDATGDIWHVHPVAQERERQQATNAAAADAINRSTRHTIGGISFDFDELNGSAAITGGHALDTSASRGVVAMPAPTRRRKSILQLTQELTKTFSCANRPDASASVTSPPAKGARGGARTPANFRPVMDGASPKSASALFASPAHGAREVPRTPPCDDHEDRTADMPTFADDVGDDAPFGPDASMRAANRSSSPSRALAPVGAPSWTAFAEDGDDDDDALFHWLQPMGTQRAMAAMRGDPQPRPLRPLSQEQQRGLVQRMERDVERRRDRARTASRSRSKPKGFVVDSVSRHGCLSPIPSAPAKLLLMPPRAHSAGTGRTAAATIHGRLVSVPDTRPPFDSRPTTASDSRTRSRACALRPPTPASSTVMAAERLPPPPANGGRALAVAQGHMSKWLRGGEYAAKSAGPLPMCAKRKTPSS
uniref:Uncharacterized protein n=1 Tax=Neobodo designis TaxID=312471 RepID=A0A7S1MSI2_NEODS